MCVIYVLKLNQDKYYVGKSNNINIRLDNHFSSSGSEWTKKYKPVEIVEKIENCDDFDEDKYTLKYMNIYGIENVRGGSFCKFELSNDNIKTLHQMLNGSNNKCYKCGKSDHFIKNCHNNNKIELFSSDDKNNKKESDNNKIELFSSDDENDNKESDAFKAQEKIKKSNNEYINFVSKCKGDCIQCNNTRIQYQYWDGEDEIYLSCPHCYCGNNWSEDMFVKLIPRGIKK